MRVAVADLLGLQPGRAAIEQEALDRLRQRGRGGDRDGGPGGRHERG